MHGTVSGLLQFGNTHISDSILYMMKIYVLRTTHFIEHVFKNKLNIISMFVTKLNYTFDSKSILSSTYSVELFYLPSSNSSTET